MSCRFFAQDLTWSEVHPGRVSFHGDKYRPDFNVDRSKPSDEPESPSLQLLEKLSNLEKTSVIQVSIGLKKTEERRWEGTTEASIQKIRAKPDMTKTRDRLIVCLDRCDIINLHFSCRSDRVARWTDNLATYMRDLLTMCKFWGNFWTYRWMCIENDKNPGDILKSELPDIQWRIPRYLVQEWTYTRKTNIEDRTVQLCNVKPYRWAPLEFPLNGYPNADEAAFLTKLGVLSELGRQSRDLSELVQSDGETWFKGIFHSLGKKKRFYAVEVYLGLDQELRTKGLPMPRPGLRIALEVDCVNGPKPQKKNIAKLQGMVVHDALETEASFICVFDELYHMNSCRRAKMDH